VRDATETTSAPPEAVGTRISLPSSATVDAQDFSLAGAHARAGRHGRVQPCAFFVLLFLLSLLVHAKSRTRMAIVGGTFVLFSGSSISSSWRPGSTCS
jgi:hypothetical protein